MGRPTATRLTIAILAIGFFATPVAARMAGVTAEAFENRRFAQAPKPSQGWDAFQQTTRFLTDRMPLRAQAVRANTRIWQDLFNTTPRYNQQTTLADDQALPFAGTVKQTALSDDKRPRPNGEGGERRSAQLAPYDTLAGQHGWRYLGQELIDACSNKISNDRALDRWVVLLQAVSAAGPRTALFVIPDKASVYPEYLPDEYPFDHCLLDRKEEFWRLLAEAGPSQGVLELRSRLLQRKERAGDGLFQRLDSHWTTLGALELVRAVLHALGDGVQIKPSEVVSQGSVPYTGDLTVLGGDPESDHRAEYRIVRAPGAPRVPGRTLFLCDSFVYTWLRVFKPYFDDVRCIDWYDTSPETTTRAIRQADRVVLETTESSYRDRVAFEYPVVAQARALRGKKP